MRNNLRKPIRTMYHDFITTKFRRIDNGGLANRLMIDAFYKKNSVFTGFMKANFKPILMETWVMKNGTKFTFVPSPLFNG